jgi:hypothetical protein
VGHGLLDLVDELLDPTARTLSGGSQDVLRNVDAAVLGRLAHRHVARLPEGVVTHQLDLVCVGLLGMRAVHRIRRGAEHLNLGAVLEGRVSHQ